MLLYHLRVYTSRRVTSSKQYHLDDAAGGREGVLRRAKHCHAVVSAVMHHAAHQLWVGAFNAHATAAAAADITALYQRGACSDEDAIVVRDGFGVMAQAKAAHGHGAWRCVGAVHLYDRLVRRLRLPHHLHIALTLQDTTREM